MFATWKISNYVTGIPIQETNVVTIAEALLNRVVYQVRPPKTLIIVENRTLSVLMHIYITLNIRSQLNYPWELRGIYDQLVKYYVNTSGEQLKTGI